MLKTWTQTRIWLGEVLQIRLNDQPIISELLADGELLFQVSKVVWKLLLAKHMELGHNKALKTQPFASKKSGGRYRPYSNVDSFLKICEMVGLAGIDLFTPSDVVERKNTRKVCMCIRSFSKKSRLMNIDVPDFDIVTCMVTMSKDVVGCIRRNIELSHAVLTYSSSFDIQKHAGEKSRQDYSVTHSTRDFEAYSNESDDTEIKHTTFQFDGVDDAMSDYTSEENYNIMSPMVEGVFISEDLDHLDIQNTPRNEVPKAEYELFSSKELLQYHCSENIDHECKMNWSSSPSCGDLHIDYSDLKSDLDTGVEQAKQSRIMDLDYSEHDFSYPDVFLEENSTPNVQQSASSQGSTSTPQSIENGTSGMSFLSREAWNLGDQFDAGNNFQKNESFNLHNDKNDQQDKIKEEYESQNITKCNETACGITSNARNSYFVKEFDETEHSLNSPDCYSCKINSPDSADSHSTAISSTQPNKFPVYEDKNSQNDLKCLDNDKNDQRDKMKEEYESQDKTKFNETACGITSVARNSYFVKEFEETEHSLNSPDCYSCKINSPDSAEAHSTATNITQPNKFLVYEDKGSQNDLKCLDSDSCNQSEEFLSRQFNSLPEFCTLDPKGQCDMTSSSAKDNQGSSCVFEGSSNKETTYQDVINAAVGNIGTDDKELKNDCLALASNAQGVDDCEKCPTNSDDANDFCGRGITTQDIGDKGQRVLHVITNDVVIPTHCDEDVLTNQSSKLECNGHQQECQFNTDDMDNVYLSEHIPEVHIQEETKPEDGSVHSLENLVETESEGSIEIPKGKPHTKLLIKSVLGGAATVGLFFMFLNRSKNVEEKGAEPSKVSSHKGTEKIQKYSAQKVKKRDTTEGVYAAEKLKLK
ncbi:putative calponin domain-containing protein [Lupinus albus]|uniref:Putative calponin domain-containing protein n=1 Tax=Lupinus albus TaxID=3870 RepID=A0A6A4PMT4_LUPAL|nr:putative calponin domain-containing protein [Lupinus albus]